jgi:hypothetical protein
MSRFKDFGSGNPEDKAPLSFKIHGEEFNCVKEIQGKVLLDLVSKAGNQDDPSAAAEMIDGFFRTVLQDESMERFDALLKSKDRIVSVETLAEITGWLVEEYTSRPEEQPEA